VLVISDMLGLYEDFEPRFVRKYATLAEDVRTAIRAYVRDIKEKKFPTKHESY
jgi:3-methyl-2-oxobutanoate hydroxymethyltransferase